MVSGGDGGATPPTRRLVAGRYELLFELARGGMGVVHVARFVGAHGFDRLVAIKELLEPDVDPRARESFLEEARVTAKIHHPNVLPTLELFEHEGRPFIVMDLVRGVSLWQLLGRLTKAEELPNVDLSAWIVMQVASGLQAAHELCDADGRPLGLVHRDVSPQNILLGFDGRVCVADFGIAKLRRATVKTESGMVKGKFAYMSPEQARGHPLDCRSDLFSLGVVLHETLTGRRLFDHDSPTETLLHIVEHPIPTPRSVRPDVPEELSAIAMRCLAKVPDARFDTAKALSRALRSALRVRQADADEQMLREVLDRVHASQRDGLTERLGALVPSPDREPTQSTTIIDLVPPVFSSVAIGSAAPPTPEASAIPMRRLPPTASKTMIVLGALVLAAGAYLAVRWSHSSAAETSLMDRSPAAEDAAPVISGDATSVSAAVTLPAPPASIEVSSAVPSRTSQPRRPASAPVGPKPVASPSPPLPEAAPAPAASPASSKGVPFRAF
jgi:eukaryotic-like serine/threonine-protein kinase